MAVSVDHLYDCESGSIFSVSHYYEQNGDLVPDADMTFYEAASTSGAR